jgi:DNA polymerase III gamma/tau subunit
MKGRRTDLKLIDEIDILRTNHSPSQIIKKMVGRVSKRSVYRILSKLKAEDEKQKMEEAEQFRESMHHWTTSRLENWQSRKRYKSSDFPPNLWRVRSF